MKPIERLLLPCPYSIVLRAWAPGEEYSLLGPRSCWSLGSWFVLAPTGKLIVRKTEASPYLQRICNSNDLSTSSQSQTHFFRFSLALDSWLTVGKKLYHNVVLYTLIHTYIPRELTVKYTAQFPLLLQLWPCRQRRQIMENNLTLGSQSLLQLWHENHISRNQLLFKEQKFKTKQIKSNSPLVLDKIVYEFSRHKHWAPRQEMLHVGWVYREVLGGRQDGHSIWDWGS